MLFPTSSRTTLYKDPISIQQPVSVNLPNSGSNFVVGWRANDLVPASGSLCFPSGSMIDGDFTTIVTPLTTTNWSIGIRCQVSGSFAAVHLYDSGLYPGFYFSGSNQRIDPYVAIYNNSWYRCATNTPINRILYSGSIYQTIIELPVGCVGKYLKLHSADGPLKDPLGNYLRFTQIQVFERVDNTATSGSYYQEYGSVPVGTNPVSTISEVALRGASF